MSGLEVVGAVVGVSSLGLQLASTIQTYVESAMDASYRFSELASEISATASIVRQIYNLLEDDKAANGAEPGGARAVLSDDGQWKIQSLLRRCETVYKAVVRVLVSAAAPPSGRTRTLLTNVGIDDLTVVKLHRVATKAQWPWLEPRIKACNDQLAALKVDLLLHLQVASLAKIQMGSQSAGDLFAAEDKQALVNVVEQLIQRKMLTKVADKIRVDGMKKVPEPGHDEPTTTTDQKEQSESEPPGIANTSPEPNPPVGITAQTLPQPPPPADGSTEGKVMEEPNDEHQRSRGLNQSLEDGPKETTAPKVVLGTMSSRLLKPPKTKRAMLSTTPPRPIHVDIEPEPSPPPPPHSPLSRTIRAISTPRSSYGSVSTGTRRVWRGQTPAWAGGETREKLNPEGGGRLNGAMAKLKTLPRDALELFDRTQELEAWLIEKPEEYSPIASYKIPLGGDILKKELKRAIKGGEMSPWEQYLSLGPLWRDALRQAVARSMEHDARTRHPLVFRMYTQSSQVILFFSVGVDENVFYLEDSCRWRWKLPLYPLLTSEDPYTTISEMWHQCDEGSRIGRHDLILDTGERLSPGWLPGTLRPGQVIRVGTSSYPTTSRRPSELSPGRARYTSEARHGTRQPLTVIWPTAPAPDPVSKSSLPLPPVAAAADAVEETQSSSEKLQILARKTARRRRTFSEDGPSRHQPSRGTRAAHRSGGPIYASTRPIPLQREREEEIYETGRRTLSEASDPVSLSGLYPFTPSADLGQDELEELFGDQETIVADEDDNDVDELLARWTNIGKA